MDIISTYSRFLLALFAILAPFASIPVFISLTGSQTAEEKARTARTAALTVFIVLVISAFSGIAILQLFGTTFAAFRVAGGLVMLLLSFSLLKARIGAVRQSQAESDEAVGREEVGVVPLGIPLMAGPGGMSMVIIEMQEAANHTEKLGIIGVIAAVCFMVWMCLRLAAPIGDKLGITGLNILNRIFGLLLASISIQIMGDGLKELLPGLGS